MLQDDKKTIKYSSPLPTENYQYNKTSSRNVHNIELNSIIELNGNGYKVIGIVSATKENAEGVIYKVKKVDTEDVYALKLYFEMQEDFEPNPLVLERIKSIENDNILRLYDYGTRDKKYNNKFCFEISEFASGGDLLTKQNNEYEELKKNIIPQIFKGLKELHKNEIVHCDIKPQNILYIDKEMKNLKIGDFGCAKIVDTEFDGDARITTNIRGTPFYIAPEQTKGFISFKSDYYSFGMVLLHLLYRDEMEKDFKKSYERIIERSIRGQDVVKYRDEYGDINDLIRGLIINDVESRWGQNEVEKWLKGIPIEIRQRAYEYSINLGDFQIKTYNDLNSYLKRDRDGFFKNLIENEVGKQQLLYWFSREYGIEEETKFKKMINNYLQDGDDYVCTAITRYFNPEIPIEINGKKINLYNSKDLESDTASFINLLDELWAENNFDIVKLILFDFELYLKILATKSEKNKKELIENLLEKMYNCINRKLNKDDPYLVELYRIKEPEFLNIVYTFNKNRRFRTPEGKIIDSLYELGIFFLKNEKLYKKGKFKYEKDKFLDFKKEYNLKNVDLNGFYKVVFKDKIIPELELIRFIPSDKRIYKIEYKCKQSLTQFFKSLGVEKKLSFGGDEVLKYENKKTLFTPFTAFFYNFLDDVSSKLKIDKNKFSRENINTFQKKCQEISNTYLRKLNLQEFLASIPIALTIIVFRNYFFTEGYRYDFSQSFLNGRFIFTLLNDTKLLNLFLDGKVELISLLKGFIIFAVLPFIILVLTQIYNKIYNKYLGTGMLWGVTLGVLMGLAINCFIIAKGLDGIIYSVIIGYVGLINIRTYFESMINKREYGILGFAICIFLFIYALMILGAKYSKINDINNYKYIIFLLMNSFIYVILCFQIAYTTIRDGDKIAIYLKSIILILFLNGILFKYYTKLISYIISHIY